MKTAFVIHRPCGVTFLFVAGMDGDLVKQQMK